MNDELPKDLLEEVNKLSEIEELGLGWEKI